MTPPDDPIDDRTLAVRLRSLPKAGRSTVLVVSPHRRRMFEVSFCIDERGTRGRPRLVARVPSGGRGRSTALRALGWQVEPVGGTRYITRRFDTSDQGWEDGIVHSLRAAYLAVYGDRRTFAHWSEESWGDIDPVTPGEFLRVAVVPRVGLLALVIAYIWLSLGQLGIWIVTSPEALLRWMAELDPVIAVPVVTTALVALVGFLVILWGRWDRDRAG